MRKSMLAKLHIAKKELALDDDAYRDVLQSVTGQRSASGLTDAQIDQVLKHFAKCGWQAKKFGKRPKVHGTREDMLRKIEAHLTEKGAHWNYAHACAKRICKVERIEWCDDEQLHKIIAALEYDARRKGYVVDQDTGEIEGKRLNSRRLDTIFRTNTQSAYMAGRWKQQYEDRELRPYWEYVAIMDDRTRPAHRMLNGRIFRWDDPIWETNYPPNGFNCRCRVRTRSQRGMEKKGLLESSSEGRLEQVEQPINRDGDTRPATAFKDADGRKFIPDAGFGYNPGQAAYQPDLDNYPTDVGRQYVQGTLTGPAFKQWYEQLENAVVQLKQQPGVAGLGDAAVKAKMREALSAGQHFPVAVIDDATRKLLGVSTKEVRLSDYDLVKQFISREGQDFSLDTYHLVQPTIEAADVIVRDKKREVTTVFLKRGLQTWSAVLQQTKTGKGLFLKSFRRSNTKDVERIKAAGDVLKGN